MSAFIVQGARVPGPEGLPVRTFQEDGMLQFPSKGKRQSVSELVIHETVTRSVEATLSSLRLQRLSVHLVLGPDGELTQHGDLVSDLLWHAGPVHNRLSVGVEVVNPYYPHLLRPGLPWSRVIAAPWAHLGAYVLPTPAQAEAVARLVDWITRAPGPGLAVPRRWPGLRGGALRMGTVAEAISAAPGILAHHYFGHADGAWLVLYAWLRLEAGLSAEDAFEGAVRRAAGARRSADVSDLIPPPTAGPARGDCRG